MDEPSTLREGSESAPELRTIGFRLREVQRLLAMRVAQENRRLEAEGLEPVEDPTFAERLTNAGDEAEPEGGGGG